MKSKDDQPQNDINRIGWHVLKIFDPDGKQPNFAYSVGVWHSFKRPEIIIFGLELKDMHIIINDIVESMKAGQNIVIDEPHSEFLQGYDCIFRAVNKKHYSEYLLLAEGFYEGDDFPVLQCFWPDNKGYYPWEVEYTDELKDVQPLLFNE